MAVDFTKVPIGTKVETAYGPGKIVLGLSPRVTVRVGDVDYPYTCDGSEARPRHPPDPFPRSFSVARARAAATRPCGGCAGDGAVPWWILGTPPLLPVGKW
jgi:hypothetical protein